MRIRSWWLYRAVAGVAGAASIGLASGLVYFAQAVLGWNSGAPLGALAGLLVVAALVLFYCTLPREISSDGVHLEVRRPFRAAVQVPLAELEFQIYEPAMAKFSRPASDARYVRIRDRAGNQVANAGEAFSTRSLVQLVDYLRDREVPGSSLTYSGIFWPEVRSIPAAPGPPETGAGGSPAVVSNTSYLGLVLKLLFKVYFACLGVLVIAAAVIAVVALAQHDSLASGWDLERDGVATTATVTGTNMGNHGEVDFKYTANGREINATYLHDNSGAIDVESLKPGDLIPLVYSASHPDVYCNCDPHGLFGRQMRDGAFGLGVFALFLTIIVLNIRGVLRRFGPIEINVRGRRRRV